MAGFTQPGNARMEPEIIIVVLATFVGGGAMGATGMLLCQWVVRKMSPPPQQRLGLMDPRDVEAMKADVADLSVRLHSVEDSRLLAPRARGPNSESGDPDDPPILADGVQRLRGFFGQAHDPLVHRTFLDSDFRLLRDRIRDMVR